MPLLKREARHCGFTLAEVLITLTIIGVIAALTIPNLVSKYQEHTWHQQWKDDFSILQSAYKLTSSENPDMQINMKPGLGMRDEFIDAMVSHLNIIDTCVPKNGTCNNKWSSGNNVNATSKYKSLSKGRLTGEGFQDRAILLKNGSAIYFGGVHVQEFVVDVNNFSKGPNILGKDVYVAAFDYSGGGYDFYTFTRNSDNQGTLVPLGLPTAKWGWIKTCIGSCDNPSICSGGLAPYSSSGGDCSYKYLYEK